MKLLDKFLNYLERRSLKRKIYFERQKMERVYSDFATDWNDLQHTRANWERKYKEWIDDGRPVTIYDENGTPKRYREGDKI